MTDDPDTVYHLRGVPDERIDIDIDTTGVALLVPLTFSSSSLGWRADWLFTAPRNAQPRRGLLMSSSLSPPDPP